MGALGVPHNEIILDYSLSDEYGSSEEGVGRFKVSREMERWRQDGKVE